MVRKLTDSKKREDDKEIMLDLRHIKQKTPGSGGADRLVSEFKASLVY